MGKREHEGLILQITNLLPIPKIKGDHGMKIVLLSLSVLFLASCSSAPAESWIFLNKEQAKTMSMSVFIDKTGSTAGIEQELSDMARLCFWDYGFLVVQDNAIYTAEIDAREREYLMGWNNKRSVSLEVRLKKDGETLAVGRVLSKGSNSLSSSKAMNKLLNMAVKKMIDSLTAALEEQK
jgi:hypothetical protein